MDDNSSSTQTSQVSSQQVSARARYFTAADEQETTCNILHFELIREPPRSTQNPVKNCRVYVRAACPFYIIKRKKTEATVMSLQQIAILDHKYFLNDENFQSSKPVILTRKSHKLGSTKPFYCGVYSQLVSCTISNSVKYEDNALLTNFVSLSVHMILIEVGNFFIT